MEDGTTSGHAEHPSQSSPSQIVGPERTAGPLWFVDATDEVGLNFIHDAGPTSDRYFMPQAMGSGAAIFDANGDGRLDVYLIQNAGPARETTTRGDLPETHPGLEKFNRLYLQETDGRFRDASKGSGLDVYGFGMGAAVGDVNNDGRPDLLLTEYGRCRVFINLTAGKFAERTAEAGLESPLWATSASFLDYDRDGWLDLVVVNYVDYDAARPCGTAAGTPDFCAPKEFAGTATHLYHNRGAAVGHAETGRFEDVTLPSGLGRVSGPGLGVVCADFSGDGWTDIFIANDGLPNRLWINYGRNGKAEFVDEALARAVAYNVMGKAEANMGVAIGDIDDNGMPDLFVTHLTEETHTLWLQKSRGIFQDCTAGSGIAKPGSRGTGFGTLLADFDHDGDLDLAVVNGRVARRSAEAAVKHSFWQPYMENNKLFANEGDGYFADISASNPPFCDALAVGRGLACGDIDNDGDLDVVVTSIAAPARLLRNEAPKRGHWLLIRAIDPTINREAYGAEITVHAGGRTWTRWLNPCYSYLCSNDSRAHFGLGPIDHVDKIEVLWPDGELETFPAQLVDRLIEIRKGEGAVKSLSVEGAKP